jgi:hypothetical protein
MRFSHRHPHLTDKNKTRTIRLQCQEEYAMLTVENVDQCDESGDRLVRDGWERTRFPAYRDQDCAVNVWGWVRGPFGIFTREFIDADAGRTAAVPLVHLRSLLRLGVFANLGGAAEAAERAELMADWDKLIGDATSRDDAEARVYEVISGDWLRGYTFSILVCPDGGCVYYRLTPEQQQQQERIQARAAAELQREAGSQCVDAPPIG